MLTTATDQSPESTNEAQTHVDFLHKPAAATLNTPTTESTRSINGPDAEAAVLTTRRHFNTMLRHGPLEELFLMIIMMTDDDQMSEIKIHPLSPTLKNKVEQLLHRYCDRFRSDPKKRPHRAYDHKIDTGNEAPHFKNPNRLSPAEMLELKK
ncbi:hypothetical protein CXG81DRAFT_19300 [Caulochytrium protostelioides]|uniref:Uncharacterized protein n=1 Tax=Caulochytrium protostelioides TaxID=1555241 RepID=A0A4P9X6M8_9FUNG|nr:hypothetical protein CXG81DRAFT_19300 [Caulochytrium protostelioides]|eukprot:RKP00828.1 hypothetical protein CXG81DRAFT_19300 [Caulochytrium protostelioides]